MQWLHNILESLRQIHSFIGLVSAGLFLVIFVCWIVYKRTRLAPATETSALLRYIFRGVLILAILLILLYASLLVLDRMGFFLNRRPTVTVFSGRVHLGDNIFARIGGKSLPSVDAPVQIPKANLVIYDKETRGFQTDFGLPTHVQWLAAHYGVVFARFNLAAWRHISDLSANPGFRPTYEGATAQVDPSTALIWIEDATVDGEGHFYSRKAIVARTVALNIYEELRSQGFRPEGRHLSDVTFYLCGLHGSRRPEQPDNVQLIVNRDIYSVPFKVLAVRTEEVVPLRIKPSSLSLEPEESTMFSLVVLPFEERHPIPPPGAEDRRGPAHFRDIEVGQCFLELCFDKT
jgi:hypothetical protein